MVMLMVMLILMLWGRCCWIEICVGRFCWLCLECCLSFGEFR